MIFATYIINHVIYLTRAKIPKDNTPGGENKAHSYRTSNLTWEEDQRSISAPEPWASIENLENLS
jgi:hypothetical protein